METLATPKKGLEKPRHASPEMLKILERAYDALGKYSLEDDEARVVCGLAVLAIDKAKGE